MSPAREGNDDNVAQAPPTIGHERASPEPAAIVRAPCVDSEAMGKVLEMLSGIDARMQKMEASQARIDEDERMCGTDESGLFASILGGDFAGSLHRGALELFDLRERHGSAQARRVGGRLDDLKMGKKRATPYAATRLATTAAAASGDTIPAAADASGPTRATAASPRAHALPNI